MIPFPTLLSRAVRAKRPLHLIAVDSLALLEALFPWMEKQKRPFCLVIPSESRTLISTATKHLSSVEVEAGILLDNGETMACVTTSDEPIIGPGLAHEIVETAPKTVGRGHWLSDRSSGPRAQRSFLASGGRGIYFVVAPERAYRSGVTHALGKMTWGTDDFQAVVAKAFQRIGTIDP